MRFVALLTALSVGLTTTAAAPPAPGGASAACSELTSSLPSSIVLTPSSSSYASAQNGGYNPLNNVLTPTCIVQPTTSAHVATAMRSIFRNQANYAVRSGGHTGMAGWDSVQGGVLIDFSSMRGFDYDANTSTVSVEPGLRWGEVYNMSEPFGVAPMGGRVSHVGTGLVLGGGLSLLSPQYGYACDGLVSADIVTVDGKVKTVNAKTDSQLLRAIKGGGGRFGVVTRYTLKAFPTGTNAEKNWYGGTITTLTPTGQDQLMQYTENFVAAQDDPKATLLTSVGTLKQAGVPLNLGIAYVFYRGTQEQFSNVFAQFLSIPGAIIDVKPLSYLEAAATTPLGWKPTQAYKWIGGSLYPNSSLTTTPIPILPALPVVNEDSPSSYLSLWHSARTFINQHLDILESSFLSLTPVRTTQINQGYAAGGNALSPPKGKNFMHYLFSTILADGTTSFPEEFEKSRLEWIQQNPSSAGLPLFLNEVDATQEAFRSYGWYEGLKRQYQRFDPTGFSVKFQQGPTF